MCLEVSFRAWESEIFQRDVFTYSFSKKFNSLKKEEKIRQYNQVKPIVPALLLYTTRIETTENNTLWFLEEQGWKCIECYLELKHTLNQIPELAQKVVVRDFEQKDLTSLEKIASESFVFDRFHTDSNLPKNLADESRVQWVRNGCNGRAKKVLVAEYNNKVIGFLLVMEKQHQTKTYGVIDLVAVDSKHRGLKAGYDLVNAFLNYCKQNQYDYAVVGTQAHNIISLNLYERCGFMIESSYYSLHKSENI